MRIKNLMLPPKEDGSREEGVYTLYQPGGEKLAIYDAAMKYMAAGVPTVIFAGEEYGTGSSRDWAAKGTQLLGIRAVVARSFERIHRSNLIGMGVLPLQFKAGESFETLGLKGDEVVDVRLADEIKPLSDATLVIVGADGTRREVAVDVYKRQGQQAVVLALSQCHFHGRDGPDLVVTQAQVAKAFLLELVFRFFAAARQQIDQTLGRMKARQ